MMLPHREEIAHEKMRKYIVSPKPSHLLSAYPANRGIALTGNTPIYASFISRGKLR